MKLLKSKPFKLKVINSSWLTKKVLRIDFSLVDPEEFNFLPGHHITLRVSDEDVRLYSICSDYKDKKKISIVVSAGHEGVGSNFLSSLHVGDEVDGVGPLGKFVVSEDYEDEIVLVATGTGVAPFIPMLHWFLDHKVKSKIRLYFGVKNEEEVYFTDILDEFKSKLGDFDYLLCLSNPTWIWDGFKGRVDDFIIYDDRKNVQIYLCGIYQMVEELSKDLAEQGVSKNNIIS